MIFTHNGIRVPFEALVKPTDSKKKVDPTEVKKLKDEKKTNKQIAKTLGVSTKTIQRTLKVDRT
ncbi:MAG: helix-turn-helix domain-containing protein [Bacteroidota bacterium]